MNQDLDRISAIVQALQQSQLDTLLVTLPENVLLVTGYWPFIGLSIAAITRHGQVALLYAEDEEPWAQHSWASIKQPWATASLETCASPLHFLRNPLQDLLRKLQIENARIGIDLGLASTPFSYVAMTHFGQALPGLLGDIAPGAKTSPAQDMLDNLRARLTSRELELVRDSVEATEQVLQDTPELLTTNISETAAAAEMERRFKSCPTRDSPPQRRECRFFVMSGPRAADAYKSFQYSSSEPVDPTRCVLVHANTTCQGFWTDVTRTYLPPHPSPEEVRWLGSILDARAAALAAIRPGATGAQVDRSAREMLQNAGLGEAFKHPLGHGVGFSAINHNALPRLHPQSIDVLAPGMVFNVEPGLYFPGRAGLRHCDMVVVTPTGCEVLTNLQTDFDALRLS